MGALFAQSEVNLRDFVRLNDIGVKIIDQKALKKHAKKLEMDKAKEKLFWTDLKQQKKDIKAELKEYNKLVYERRRLEETEVRMGGGSDSSNVPYIEKIKQSTESLHAKKEELIFNKKELEEVEEIALKAQPSLIPPRRANYPWHSDVPSDCDNHIFIDLIHKDTTIQMATKTVFDNETNFLRSADMPQAKCQLALLKERGKLFVIVDWKEISEEEHALWRLSKEDMLSITLEDGTSFDLYYEGVERNAICNKDQTIQQFQAKYRMLEEDIQNCQQSPLQEISLFSENRQLSIPIGKKWIDKPGDWKPVEFFLTYIPCFK